MEKIFLFFEIIIVYINVKVLISKNIEIKYLNKNFRNHIMIFLKEIKNYNFILVIKFVQEYIFAIFYNYSILQNFYIINNDL